MLPFASGLSYASAVLPALRTQAATRNHGFADPGVQVHVLIVDHPRVRIQVDPSKTKNLNSCGPTPPVIVALNWTGVPTGDGADRLGMIPVSTSGEAGGDGGGGDGGGAGGGGGALDPEIGKAMLPLDPLLS
jgi:hypothetical protein